MSNPVGQSACSVCGQIARPGSAVVLNFGAGGRVHKECLARAQNSVPMHDPAPGGTERPFPQSVTMLRVCEGANQSRNTRGGEGVERGKAS
jgi:hypothetical protein